MSILGGVYIQRGADTGSTGPETASILLSDGLSFLRLLLSHLSPSMSFYLHSRLFSSNSLPDRGRGAALLLRVEHRGLCRAEWATHKKRWFVKGEGWVRALKGVK